MRLALNLEQSLLKETQVRSFCFYLLFISSLSQHIYIDIYCYVCNDSKRDPELSVHLASFGINVQTLSKTEKSMTELVWILLSSFSKSVADTSRDKKSKLNKILNMTFLLPATTERLWSRCLGQD